MSSFVDVLRSRAQSEPDRPVFGMWGESDIEAWMTFGELDARARAIAVRLMEQVEPGERALLLYAPGFDYVAAFFGCLYAGVIAVPAYPPEPARLERTLPRLQAIIVDAQASTVLTTNALLSLVEEMAAFAPDLRRLRWMGTDTMQGVEGWRAPTLGPDHIAFLQYTSGSTGVPKGVMLSHANLLANSQAIQNAHEYTRESRKVTWLPPYHDMGLIGSILQPVYTGFSCVLLSPIKFLLKPLRWLQAISKTRGTAAGAPNFAFDLCARKVTPEQRQQLDLSSWDLAYCGAEPVRRDTLQRFAERFAESGFRATSFAPCYGLAEGTLIVTGVKKGTGFHVHESDVVSVGRAVAGGEIAIVDPERQVRLDDGAVGEIWVHNESVARGYWNRPEETQATFGARLDGSSVPGWLRTGDLGFVEGGQLYVSGRLKELLIVRGQKHFPSDIEATIEQSQWEMSHFRPGGSAAVSLVVEGEERLFLIVEVERRQRERRRGGTADVERRNNRDRRRRPHSYRAGAEPSLFEADSVIRSLRSAVTARHGIEVFGVVLVRPGSIPKTTSGKKQRVACKKQFLAPGAPEVLHAWPGDQLDSIAKVNLGSGA